MAGKTRAERLAELEAQREAIEAEEDDEPEHMYELWDEKGRGIRAGSKSPVGKRIPAYLKEKWNFDLADEPVQEEPEAESKPKAKPATDEVGAKRAFQRRIG